MMRIRSGHNLELLGRDAESACGGVDSHSTCRLEVANASDDAAFAVGEATASLGHSNLAPGLSFVGEVGRQP